VVVLILGFAGAKEVDDPVINGLAGFNLLDSNINSWVWVSRVCALYYFAYFLIITPILGLRETPLPVPESISTPVLSHPAAAPAGAPAAPEKKG
jgi:ubiquinol-cytochrome c reductase cytochrome b subunit